MKNIIKIFVTCLVILSMMVPSFAKSAQTLLEVRELQTRYFETNNEQKVMKAVINTLQDNGFIIQNIENEMGYITAKKDFRARRTDKTRVAVHCFWIATAAVTYGISIPVAHMAFRRMSNELSLHPVVVDTNITIEKVGKRTKVRFSLVEKIMENSDGYMFVKSSPRKVVRYYTPEIYQEFFNQVDKNLFLEKNL